MPIDINLLRVENGKCSSPLHTCRLLSHIRYLPMFIGGDPEKVKASERARFRDDSIVDQIIEIDNKWRKSMLHCAISNKVLLNSEIRC